MTLARVLRTAARDNLLPGRYAWRAWQARSWGDAKIVLRGEQSWNSAVYEACAEHGVGIPDLPVRDVEVYGQAGEDLVVRAVLEAKAHLHGVDLRQERYLEVGGNHPFAGSATYLLSKHLGMTGVIVEANPERIDELVTGRPDDVIVHAAVQDDDVTSVDLWVPRYSEIASLDHAFVSRWAAGRRLSPSSVRVPAVRMDDIVRDHLGGRAPLFLSIDVEGVDFALLADFDFRTYRPWLVQVEPSDDHVPGNTDRMVRHMQEAGYTLIAMTWVNLIFLDASV